MDDLKKLQTWKQEHRTTLWLITDLPSLDDISGKLGQVITFLSWEARTSHDLNDLL